MNTGNMGTLLDESVIVIDDDTPEDNRDTASPLLDDFDSFDQATAWLNMTAKMNPTSSNEVSSSDDKSFPILRLADNPLSKSQESSAKLSEKLTDKVKETLPIPLIELLSESDNSDNEVLEMEIVIVDPKNQCNKTETTKTKSDKSDKSEGKSESLKAKNKKKKNKWKTSATNTNLLEMKSSENNHPPKRIRLDNNNQNLNVGKHSLPSSSTMPIFQSQQRFSNVNIVKTPLLQLPQLPFLCLPPVFPPNFNNFPQNPTSLVSRFPQTNSTSKVSNLPHPSCRKLRPIAIDGSNIAYSHGKSSVFSCKGIQICVDYFMRRGHTTVKAFVPQFRRTASAKDVVDTHILERLARGDQYVVFTPSRIVRNKLIYPYDDRFILDYACQTGAVVVSNDNYRDLLRENGMYRETIEERLLMYTFADDVFMVPQDPLGKNGPTLDKFLSFSK